MGEAGRLQPLGQVLHDFDIDEIGLDESGRRPRTIGDLRRLENIGGRQRAAIQAAGVKDAGFGVVTDERGRRRFHGAFTGGFSAGYFNTVGSEQNWAPSHFQSSRRERGLQARQRITDYADEEDLLDFRAEETRDAPPVELARLQWVKGAEGMGTTAQLEAASLAAITDVIEGTLGDRAEGLGVGARLLKGLHVVRGDIRMMPHDKAFQYLLARRRAAGERARKAAEAVVADEPLDNGEEISRKRRKIGPEIPRDLSVLRNSTKDSEPLQEARNLRNRNLVTGASLRSLLHMLRNPHMDYGGVGSKEAGVSRALALEQGPLQRLALLDLSCSDASLLPISDLQTAVAEGEAGSGALAIFAGGTDGGRGTNYVPEVAEHLPGEALESITAGRSNILRMSAATTQRRDAGDAKDIRNRILSRPVEKGRDRRDTRRGLREVALGRQRMGYDDEDAEEEDESAQYNLEITEGDELNPTIGGRGGRRLEENEESSEVKGSVNIMDSIEKKMKQIVAQRECIPGFSRPTSDMLTIGFDWATLRDAVSVKAPANYRPRPVQARQVPRRPQGSNFTRRQMSPSVDPKKSEAKGIGELAPLSTQPSTEGLWIPPGQGVHTQVNLRGLLTDRFTSGGATMETRSAVDISLIDPETGLYKPRRFRRNWIPSRVLCRSMGIIYGGRPNAYEDLETTKSEIALYLRELDNNSGYTNSFRLPRVTSDRMEIRFQKTGGDTEKTTEPRIEEEPLESEGNVKGDRPPREKEEVKVPAMSDFMPLYEAIFGDDD